MAQLSGNGRRKRHVQRKAGMRKRRNFTILAVFSRTELRRRSLRGNAEGCAGVCFALVAGGGGFRSAWVGSAFCLCFLFAICTRIRAFGCSVSARVIRPHKPNFHPDGYSSINSSSPEFSTFMIVPLVNPRVARKRACFARSAGVVGRSPYFLLQTSRARVSSVLFNSAPAS